MFRTTAGLVDLTLELVAHGPTGAPHPSATAAMHVLVDDAVTSSDVGGWCDPGSSVCTPRVCRTTITLYREPCDAWALSVSVRRRRLPVMRK